jgi:hypothetical protein
MKTTDYKYAILSGLLLCLFYGCTNQYEKQAAGYYEVGSYERIDSLSTNKIDLPASLTPNDDKTFLLVFKDSTSKGKWKAGDDGDRTWISFYYNGEMRSDGDMGNGLINIWNPSDFNCPELKTLVFKRVNKK